MHKHRPRIIKSARKSGSLSLVFRWHRSRFSRLPVASSSKLKVDAPRLEVEYRAVGPYQCQRWCNSCSIPRSRNKTLKARERRSAICRKWDTRVGRGGEKDRARRMPSRGLDAEKTSMVHLRGEYSWVTRRARASERVDGPARVAHRDGIVEETEGEKGEGVRDTGSLLAAISSYAPAPIYPPALRISHHGSLQLSRPSILRPPFSRYPLRILYWTSDNAISEYTDNSLMSHCRSYVPADTNARHLHSIMLEVK